MVASRNRRFGDITSMLITIYGSKEKFVDEYHSLLAERLLELTDYNVENQVEQLELLKLRFGEDQMQSYVAGLAVGRAPFRVSAQALAQLRA